ncbi:MAG: hypothetical protein Q4D65_01130 [Peptostreptococcaceae bacterium]|nr:hypothetical protein [Peptostreptococcaceae bacterium]
MQLFLVVYSVPWLVNANKELASRDMFYDNLVYEVGYEPEKKPTILESQSADEIEKRLREEERNLMKLKERRKLRDLNYHIQLLVKDGFYVVEHDKLNNESRRHG